MTGCVWDKNGCAGAVVPAACAFGDYGVVPGCVFSDGAWGCGGTPTPCEGRTASTCNAGCVAATKCVGGPISCGGFGCNGCPGPCESAPGCAIDSIGFCSGNTTCEAQKTQSHCMWDTTCTWMPCQGTPTPCGQLDMGSCASAPGCAWGIVPL